MPPPEPAQLGQYRLHEKLGQGGMAMVYRGELSGEAGFKKKVAIKRMLPQYRRDPSLLERFAAEARTNARLDHPNLVAVVDFGIEPEPFLVMEFVEGVTLALLLQRLVEKKQRLEVAAACFIGAEAAAGLDHAHRRRDEQGNPLGIVHRDVSPQNVLLSNEGAVKVSDFGLVKVADAVVQTGSGIPIGKMSYMAPEQASHVEVDARADVFSLGIVVWEMLTLRTLMPPNDMQRASEMLKECRFHPPSRYNPDVSPALDAIVMACLAREPGQRTPSAQALGMQLRETLHEIAPGYGRDQLARLLGWVFPEKGWQIDEPHETAAQPSLEERMSMPQVSAAQAMQRASYPSDPPPERAAAPAAAARPIPVASTVPLATAARPKRSRALLWVGIAAFVGLLLLGGAVGLGLLFYTVNRAAPSDGQPAPGAQPAMQPMPGTSGSYGAVSFEAMAPGARLFLGARELGPSPQRIATQQLTGEPLVVLAPGHEPSIVDPARLASLVASQHGIERVSLAPSARPSLAVYVHHPRPAQARVAHTGQVLGAVPGLLLVAPTALGGTPELEVYDGHTLMARLDTAGCDRTAVCVRGAQHASPPRMP